MQSFTFCYSQREKESSGEVRILELIQSRVVASMFHVMEKRQFNQFEQYVF